MTRKTLLTAALVMGAVLLAACGPREPENDATAAAMPGGDVAAETAETPAPAAAGDTATATGVKADSVPPTAPPTEEASDQGQAPPPKY